MNIEDAIEGLGPQQAELVRQEWARNGGFPLDSNGWVRFYRDRRDGIQLDGDFTTRDLRTLISVMEKVWPSL